MTLEAFYLRHPKKLYKFVYQDTTKEWMEYMDALGKEVLQKTSKHQPAWDTPIEYYENYCFIYSDNEIPELKESLVMENVIFGYPIQPHSTIIFQDNWDSETSGTTPDNWILDTVAPFSTFLVSNAQSKSSPNSMHLADLTGTGYCRYEYATGEGTGEKIYWSNYIVIGARYYYYSAMNAVGDYNAANATMFINYRADGHIWYLDVGVNTDSGVHYTVGAMRDNIIVPNYETETFDL